MGMLLLVERRPDRMAEKPPDPHKSLPLFLYFEFWWGSG
jgi:hypothetical protein